MAKGKPEGKERTDQKSVSLPTSDWEMIELLAKNGMIGSNRSAVVRSLVQAGLKGLVESEYVKKQIETMKLLREGTSG